MKLKTFIVGVMIFTLSACFHDSDDDVSSGTQAASKSIYVVTVSGDTEALDGTLTRPCATNALNQDYRLTETISGTSATRTEYLYTSNDGSCSGVEIVDAVYDVTFRAGGVMAITGWQDLGGVDVPPPLAQDGSGPLSETESVTSLILTINSVTPPNPSYPPGSEWLTFYVIDDTVAFSVVAYGISDYDSQKAFNVPMTHQ